MKPQVRIALLTFKDLPLHYTSLSARKTGYPLLTLADNKVLQYLEKKGLYCRPFAWDDQNLDLNEFDIFIIRSTWNYYYSQENTDKFLDFVHKIGPKIYNCEKIIKWNHNKKYLKTLADNGIPTIPGLYLEEIKSLIIENIKEISKDNHGYVVKPLISGASRNTYFIKDINDSGSLDMVSKYLKSANIREMLVQPFLPTITNIGELSCIFFRDTFSHAVIKTASANNFSLHTGISLVKSTPIEAISIAHRSLLAIYDLLTLSEKSCLYARIDLLFDKNIGYLISEVELIEPDLFLEYKKESLSAFCREIVNTLK